MRSRRSGRNHLRDIFFNTGDEHEKTVNESFDYSREFIDVVNQEMLDDERVERKHKQEETLRNEITYPSCLLSEKPIPGKL
ncbi:hypothetical protein [Pontibacter liquoris]|uniref:hypothetical protein n=1 Tax=Pontibacter liquoris TaxID=2905677 RepID=UPI001FA7157B|nr:hypothetical protein [Pontibacter liquoris]